MTARNRYTEHDLKLDVDKLNLALKASGSSHSLSVNPRNGYCAVDVHKAVDGRIRNLRMLEAGSPKVCHNACVDFSDDEIAEMTVSSK